MRLVSTKESFRLGEPSALAIAETLTLTVAAVVYGWSTAYWWPLFASSVVAPFTLLRTKRSMLRVYFIEGWLHRKIQSMRPPANLLGLFVIPFYLVFALLTPLIARFLAFVAAFVKHPIESLECLPENWWRAAFVTDACRSPSMLPSAEEIRVPKHYKAFQSHCELYSLFSTARKLANVTIEEQKGLLPRLAAMQVFFLFLAVSVAAALVYRVSAKMSAAIWSPLIWAIKPVKRREMSWETYFKLSVELSRVRAILCISLLGFVAFLVKCLLTVGRVEVATKGDEFSRWLSTNGLEAAPGLIDWAVAFVRPGHIPLWHVAAFVNSCLGLTYVHIVNSHLVHKKYEAEWSETTLSSVVRGLLFVRRLFTTYIVSCNLYLLYLIADKIPVPYIETRLFPWL